MKRLLLAIVVLCYSLCAIASGQNSSLLQGLKSPASEITELEDLIAKAKATGQTPDPAWTTRIRELIPMVKGHASKVPTDLQSIQIDGGFAPGAVIRPTELTPLEQQIRALEFELSGGLSFQGVDPVTFANLKERLNELYSQRPENRESNPLDQGNSVCPGAVVPEVPWGDTGTTVGMGNDYNPISPCAASASNDVIYEFTPLSTQTYSISLANSSYDTYLYVNTGGGCPGNTQVACNDDYFGLQSYVEVVLNAGQTYYIIVDGYSAGRQGDYAIYIDDLCEIPIPFCDVLECFENPGPGFEAIDCNGSCQNTSFGGVDSWQEITPFQTICGLGFTYTTAAGNPFRDVDTYRFTVAEPCSLALTINAEFASQMIVIQGSCPYVFASNFFTWTYACSTVTFVTDCLQPGAYALVVLPASARGYSEPRNYRASVDLVPCSGCKIDEFLQAPGTGAWNTCGAGNDNDLRPSEEYTFAVNIPYDGNWTFSTCNDDSIWDEVLYLTSPCYGPIYGADDDGCGGVGLSVISCLPLTAGTYYLTVEGYFEDDCGPFTLSVFECLGSCCYGDPLFPACDYISQSACNALAGTWTNLEPCSTGACFTRPDCGGGEVMFSQEPIVPGEPWGAAQSDSEGGFRVYEDYSVSSAIGSIRFWGVFGFQACDTVPHGFEITFIDSVNNLTQTYNVTLTPNVLPLVYFGVYQLLEYTAELNPPCTITNGWLSIAETSSPSCYFNWSSTVLGNGQFGYTILQNESQYEIIQLSGELAFCLSAGCAAPDSVTIRMLPDFTDAYSIRWWQPAGLVRAWWSSDPTAVFPATYTEFFSLNLPQGSYSNAFFAPDPSPEVIYVLTLDCGAPPSATGLPLNPMVIPQNEVK